MKKFSLAGAIIFFVGSSAFGAAGSGKRLDSYGNPLQYEDVEIANTSNIPITISWYENTAPNPGISARDERFQQVIAPHATETLQLGLRGRLRNESGSNARPKVIYAPVLNDPTYTEEFFIDLQKSNPITFTAESLADILKNIMRLGVTYSDEEGNPKTFQRIGMEHPSVWEKSIMRIGKERPYEEIAPMKENKPELEE